MSESTPRCHLMTVSVEDYFQSQDLERQVRFKQWERIESRVARSVDSTLEFFAGYNVHATFFVSGWTAERNPQLVASIASAGHEVASAGYSPRRSARTHADSLRNDLRMARELLESQGSNTIYGYRASHWLAPEDLWTLDVLADEGYRYDASVNPVLRRFAHHPELARAAERPHPGHANGLWEFPVSTERFAGVRVPITGGNYVRQLPHTLLKHSVARWDAREPTPLLFYFMSWELDPEQPRFDGLPRLTAMRHYRGLAKTRWVLEEYLSRYRFQSVAEHLGLSLDRLPVVAREAALPSVSEAALPHIPSPWEGVTDVTIVVPVFNEELNIAFLRGTLLRLRRRLADRYRIFITLVDDGSTDNTVAGVRAHFAGVEDFTLLEHGTNRGIAAAIMTGLYAAPSELVCTLDADCSYDPDVLERMIPLAHDADLVTASPYHPDGRALNVPEWRLVLSRTLSRMYRKLVDAELHTFTSCCRVHRKSVFGRMTLEHDDFLGIAEMLLRAGMQGSKIVEFPATLESRLFGQSKMKTAKVIRGHLGLLKTLASQKLRGEASAGF